MPKVTCPNCGQRGETSSDSELFDVRGTWEGWPVRACRSCNAWLQVKPGLRGPRARALPLNVSRHLSATWYSQWGPGWNEDDEDDASEEPEADVPSTAEQTTSAVLDADSGADTAEADAGDDDTEESDTGEAPADRVYSVRAPIVGRSYTTGETGATAVVGDTILVPFEDPEFVDNPPQVAVTLTAFHSFGPNQLVRQPYRFYVAEFRVKNISDQPYSASPWLSSALRLQGGDGRDFDEYESHITVKASAELRGFMTCLVPLDDPPVVGVLFSPSMSADTLAEWRVRDPIGGESG